MLEGAWVQKDEAMKALHKVLRYKFSLGQTTASTLHESRLHAWGRVGSKGWSYEERSSDRGTRTLFVGEFLSTHVYTDLKSELKSELKPQSLPPKIQDPRFPENFSWMQAGNLGCTQDPRSKIPRIFFLDAGWKSWMHPRSKIQDFQKTSLGNLGNLGINPRSKILGASKILQVHPRKVFWKSWTLGASKISSLHPRKIFWESWILDLGCIQDSASASKKSFLEILDLGSWVYPEISKKSFGGLFFGGIIFFCVLGFFFGSGLEKESPGRKEGRKEGRRKEGRKEGKGGRGGRRGRRSIYDGLLDCFKGKKRKGKEREGKGRIFASLSITWPTFSWKLAT